MADSTNHFISGISLGPAPPVGSARRTAFWVRGAPFERGRHARRWRRHFTGHAVARARHSSRATTRPQPVHPRRAHPGHRVAGRARTRAAVAVVAATGRRNLPRRPRRVGKDKITVPVEKKVELSPPEPPKVEPPPADLTIPAKPMADATQNLPGLIESSGTSTTSQGSGLGRRARAREQARASGSGQGSGLGPGYGGGTGGGAYRPGAGITLPRVLKEVKPAYTADAMRAKVQGSVWLECIVMPDGSVGEVEGDAVARSRSSGSTRRPSRPPRCGASRRACGWASRCP